MIVLLSSTKTNHSSKKRMKVCIAEKPSVAREIAQVIGAKHRQDGYFEGNGYAVTWTFGHFCTLYAPDDYEAEWKKWRLETLPMLPERFETRLMNDKGVKKQFKVIKNLFKKASVVINCGDAGQEGELIQRWVIKEAGYKGKVLRLWISSLTTEAIKDGFSALQPAHLYDNLYHAGSSRAIGDWLLGMNATRLFTLRYGGYKQVLSIGRVQTPTLAMLVQRHKEIENFKPEPYWELQTIFKEATFNCTKGKFFKQEDGQKLYDQVLEQPFEITKVEKKQGKELPPKLFDLTSLQVHCNKRFGFTADRTLKLTQALYEKKLVTYPRVDTTFLPNDVYPKISGILQKLTAYQQWTQPLLGKTIRKSKKVFNDKKVTDHHAIIPTGYQQQLPPQEQQVYDSITRRFIAAFYPDCKVSNTTVLGESNKVPFKATGKEILEPGWRVVLQAPNTKQQKDEKILPTFQEGETGPHEPSLVQKQTQPPKNYTEATLLRAMETAGKQVDDEALRDLMKENGIGRPSTRAAIIETLFRRQYIRRKKKLVLPTEIGIALVDLIQDELLKSAELTGQWEKKLKEIEAGEYGAGVFIREMKQLVHQLVATVKQAPSAPRLSAKNLPKASTQKASRAKRTTTSKSGQKQAPSSLTAATCPKCQKGTLLKGQQAYGCSQWKTGCDFKLPFKVGEKTISEKQWLRLLDKGRTIQLKGFVVEGSKQAGYVELDDKHQVQLKVEAPTATKKSSPKPKPTNKKVLTCPKCQQGSILKGQQAYGCSRWREGCDLRLPFEKIRAAALTEPVTEALVWRLLEQAAK